MERAWFFNKRSMGKRKKLRKREGDTVPVKSAVITINTAAGKYSGNKVTIF